jgi:hypothetical protein
MLTSPAPGEEPPRLAPVAERARDAVGVGEQPGDRALHVDVHAECDGALLQGADQLQAGAVTDVREAGVAVAAEVALADQPVGGAVEQRAPVLELAHPVGRLLRVQLGHPPVVEHLPAAHGVPEVHPPAVLRIGVAHRCGDPALGHDGVRLAEQGLADDGGARPRLVRGDRGPQAGAAGSDDHDVVGVPFQFHQKNLGSVIVPVASRKT